MSHPQNLGSKTLADPATVLDIIIFYICLGETIQASFSYAWFQKQKHISNIHLHGIPGRTYKSPILLHKFLFPSTTNNSIYSISGNLLLKYRFCLHFNMWHISTPRIEEQQRGATSPLALPLFIACEWAQFFSHITTKFRAVTVFENEHFPNFKRNAWGYACL